jgi:hypothetical protein
MEYEIDIKSIIKESKTDKCENTDSIEEIKKRIHDKISMITINYNKYLSIDIGFNMKKMAIALTYRHGHERKKGLLALEKYLDELLEYYLENGNIRSLKEL